MNLVKDILLEQPFHIMIGDYLNYADNKKILLLNKTIFNNKINRSYSVKLIYIKSSKIIFNFMKKYLEYSRYIRDIENLEMFNLITKKIIASYYFKFYDKKYINSLYNNQTGLKKNIIELYKTKNIDNPSRIDLFNLIKKMPMDDVAYIGW